jgi:hypothetical protein
MLSYGTVSTEPFTYSINLSLLKTVHGLSKPQKNCITKFESIHSVGMGILVRQKYIRQVF